MATFVFVAGAWHSAWAWERVLPLIEQAGHRAIAPDLRGMGEDQTPLRQVSLALWVDQLSNLILAQAEPVILVGHSRGGVVVSAVAESVPERIRSSIYVAALLVDDGDTAAAASARDANAPINGEIIDVTSDGIMTIDPLALRRLFYGSTDPIWVQRALESVTPEPGVVSMTPIRLTDDRYGTVPRAYIECTEDKVLTLEYQREMQAKVRCNPVFTLRADHSPFYSDPAGLAARLLDIGGGPSPPIPQNA